MKYDHSSRFRILKGGKISLVVSALLVSCSLSTSVNAEDINDAQINTKYINAGPTTLNITSSGSITVTDDEDPTSAIYVTGSHLDITITNAGTLDDSTTAIGTDRYAHAKGINFSADSNYATITNEAEGTIEVSTLGEASKAMGIHIEGYLYDTDITNAGTITATTSGDNYDGTGSNAFGINIENTNSVNQGIYFGSTITNSGTITTTATGYNSNSIGINLEDGDIYESSISSSGRITSSSEGRWAKAMGINIQGNVDQATITNSGDIITQSTGEYGYAFGINVQDDMTATGTITNTSTGEITVQNSYTGRGIYVNDLYGSVSNAGSITATSNNYSHGIYIGHFYTDGSIENSGTITVDGAQKAYGIYTEDRDDTPGTITNSSSGTITALLNGEAHRNAFALYVSGADITNNGILEGNLWQYDGTFTNTGTINLPYNANEDHNKIAYIDNLINSGIIRIGLKTDGSAGDTADGVNGGTIHSQLKTRGDATFNTGSKIYVNVLDSSTNVGDLLDGTTLNDVVITEGTLIINDLSVLDSSALIDFEYEKDDNTIDLTVIQAQSIEEAVSTPDEEAEEEEPSDVVEEAEEEPEAEEPAEEETEEATPTQNYEDRTEVTPVVAAARALDTINANLSKYSQMAPVISALNTLPTNSAVSKAVESTTPQTTGASVGAASQISGGITGIVEQRQNVALGGGLNSGDEMFSNKNAWIKPFGSIGSQNDKDGLNGFDLKAYGVGIGIDGEYKPNQTLGFAFFYTNANVDVNNVSQTSDLDVFTTLIYGNVPVIDEKTKFMYQLGYAWQKTNGERNLFTGATAKSDYTAKTASLDLKLARNYKINDKLVVQPMIEGTYRHFTSPSYSETGAGALNLNIQEFTSTELIVGGGTIAYYKLDEDSKLVGNINVGYDIHDRQQSVTASYQGASGVSFDTQGIDNGRWNYDLGFGYEMDMDENSNLNFSYNMQGQGSDFRNNTIAAKYVLKF